MAFALQSLLDMRGGNVVALSIWVSPKRRAPILMASVQHARSQWKKMVISFVKDEGIDNGGDFIQRYFFDESACCTYNYRVLLKAAKNIRYAAEITRQAVDSDFFLKREFYGKKLRKESGGLKPRDADC
ncbi:MAG: hypothetical protein LBD58_11225 [Treponema sp.]|nr:hypothetical protein [Treponema sp.]